MEARDSSELEGQVRDVIIIGGGPAGASAALYCARAGLATLVLDKGLSAGSAGVAAKIANYPGIDELIAGAELVRRMRRQAEGAGATFRQARVLGTYLEETPKQIQSTNGIDFARAVIIATGSMGRSATVPGEERLLGRGVSYCATCDGAFFRGETVAVVGGNDEAAEEALFLTRLAETVHFMVPEPQPRVDESLMTQLVATGNLTIRTATRLLEITGENSVEAVRVQARQGGEEVVAVTGVFLYLQGRRPVTDFIGDQVNLTPDGCVEVDDALQTSVPGVFAAGDILCGHIKQVVIAAGEGARAAIAVDRFLSGRGTLRPDWA